jgi:hypothetical protein
MCARAAACARNCSRDHGVFGVDDFERVDGHLRVNRSVARQMDDDVGVRRRRS